MKTMQKMLGGVALALTLAGCGDGNYENFEECQLKETLSQSGCYMVALTLFWLKALVQLVLNCMQALHVALLASISTRLTINLRRRASSQLWLLLFL